MAREVRIPYEKLKDPQTITQAMEQEFEAQGLNLHVNEVEKLDDDDQAKERVLRIKNTKYFFR